MLMLLKMERNIWQRWRN